ncbi:MAG: hypothetical protein ACRD10_00780, partial [Terriglobia bacterium]
MHPVQQLIDPVVEPCDRSIQPGRKRSHFPGSPFLSAVTMQAKAVQIAELFTRRRIAAKQGSTAVGADEKPEKRSESAFRLANVGYPGPTLL